MSKEKTIYELAKEFPEKTYRELENYREADRQDEAYQIPLTESQQKQEELEPITKGVCVTGALRKDREAETLTDHYEKEIWKLKQLLSKALQDTNTLEGTKRIVIELSKEKITLKKRAQEAEGELSILKGIETNRVKEAEARCDHLSLELDRIKRDNVNLYSRISELTEVDESHQKMNGKLQTRLTELEEENKKLSHQIEDRVNKMRKSGM